jgi:preprotein translocase subunit YajC
MFFISPAFAQEATEATAKAAEAPGLLVTMAPLVLVFIVFYAVVIRPQNKRLMEHRKTINELKKGDKIVTGGGVIGTVKQLQGEDELVVEIANGVDITVLRPTILSIRSK